MITVFLLKTPRTKRDSKRRSRVRRIEENPLMQFKYPSSKYPHLPYTTRKVRLIAANRKYFIGLEVIEQEGRKPKHQFKRFRRDEVLYPELIEFNPSALS